MMGGATRFTAFLGLAAVFALACGSAGGSTPATTTGEDIVIGAPMSITGTQSKEGALAKQGYDMWLQWVNKQGGIKVKKVKHRVPAKLEDQQRQADISAQLAQKLITE